MSNKQNFNGNKGEARTYEILSERFIVSTRSVDVDGADFIVEIPLDDIGDFRQFKEQGVIQAKFFEGNNEVKIAKKYVENKEGTRTNFFTLIHTDDKLGNKVRYFFTANEIRSEFKQRSAKKTQKEYYIFRLSKKRKFDQYANLSDQIINRRIEEGISQTEQYKQQLLVQEIEEKFNNPIQNTIEDKNSKLFKEIEGKHIVDKLYRTLNSYKDFRRITSWLLIDKISFYEKPRTSTYYNQFCLHTNHSEIINFFKNLEIGNDIVIKDRANLKGVNDVDHKIKRIVAILNDNLIIKFKNLEEKRTIDIQQKNSKICSCLLCSYNNLNFSALNNSLSDSTYSKSDLWSALMLTYTTINFGRYNEAKILLKDISNYAKLNKKPIIYFLAKYNLRQLAFIDWEENYPNLTVELRNLNTSSDNKEILKSISENTLTNDYANAIDEIYLKIKDFKQRRIINDTADLIIKLSSKFSEYINFIEGNFLAVTKFSDFKTLTEKVVESFVISYSMNTKYSNHVNFLNDFLVRIIIHHCEPVNLLNYFQRNNVNGIEYESETNYFQNSVDNFFSKNNVEFLCSEINYFDNKTKNIELRRKSERIFENICFLMAYLKMDLNTKGLLDKISFFIEKLDFGVHIISRLAHPLLKKSELFETHEILNLIKILINKDLVKGYLLTNCLLTLSEKQFKFKLSNKELVDSIIDTTLKNAYYGSLKVLPDLLPQNQRKQLEQSIILFLNNEFDKETYYEAVVNNCLEHPKIFFHIYIKPFESIKNVKTSSIFNRISPYTGLNYRLAERLNRLVEVLISIDDYGLIDSSIVKGIMKIHPYYNFILGNDKKSIPENFDALWLLENQSTLVLQKISLLRKF